MIVVISRRIRIRLRRIEPGKLEKVNFLQMNERTSLTWRPRLGSSWEVPAFAAVLLAGSIWAGAANGNQAKKVPNPHGDPALCSECHTSAKVAQGVLRYAGDVSQLCWSCHDGHLAAGEPHPVDMIPSAQMARRIPSVFPLEKGKLGCLSCHDIAWHCKLGRPASMPNRSFLRGESVSHPLAFCFQCHNRENYRPFNAHDQLEAGKIKTDTCAWCHIGVPDVKSRLAEGASYALRSESFGVCNNCHLVNKGHPTGDPHMYATPPTEMIWHMSAYEMQPQMRLPLKQLEEYVRAAKRKPRSIPLDEKGRITCYSCHNPHEKGLLPSWNLRSVGAEPKQATNHRLRTHGGIACRACHQK